MLNASIDRLRLACSVHRLNHCFLMQIPDTVVGPVDILINCAGISQTSFLKRTSDDELGDIVDTNLMATMLVCKHAKLRPYGTPPSRLGSIYSPIPTYTLQDVSSTSPASWPQRAAPAPRHMPPPKQASSVCSQATSLVNL